MEARDIIEAVDQLPDKYIVYEMNLRKQTLLRSTMASRKRRLIEILTREAQTGQLSDMVFFMKREDDLSECVTFLEEIEMDMTVGLGTNASRCEFQLMFLKERIERLGVSPSVAMNDIRLRILNRIEELEKQFKNVTVVSGMDDRPKTPTSQHGSADFLSRLNSMNLNGNGTGNFSVGPRHSSTNHTYTATPHFSSASGMNNVTRIMPSVQFGDVNATTQETTHAVNNNTMGQPTNLNSSDSRDASTQPASTTYYPGYNPRAQMWKWNLHFSGDGDEMLASDFIQKLKDLAQSRGVSNAEVLNGMPELLTGSAAKWYRTVVRDKPFDSLGDFSTRFLEDFEPFYKVDTRLEMLRKRLQQPTEKIVMYFAHMENEFHTMPHPPTVKEQIRLIRKNLLPQFITQLALQSFETVHELKTACKQIELSYEMVNSQNQIRGHEVSAPYPNYPLANGGYPSVTLGNNGSGAQCRQQPQQAGVVRNNFELNRYQRPPTTVPNQQVMPQGAMQYVSGNARPRPGYGYNGSMPTPNTNNPHHNGQTLTYAATNPFGNAMTQNVNTYGQNRGQAAQQQNMTPRTTGQQSLKGYCYC